MSRLSISSGIADGTGEAALEVAQAEHAAGVREQPPHSNTGERVREYLRGCTRDVDRDGDEDRLGLVVANWCAAFVGWCDHVAGLTRPWRASVAEICADARRAGVLHLAGDGYQPRPGDLAIFKRDGQNPLQGGLGHVARVEAHRDGMLSTIDGNHEDGVMRVTRTMPRPELVAWVEYPRRSRASMPVVLLGDLLATSAAAAGLEVGGGPEDFTTYDEGPSIGQEATTQ